MLNGRSLHIRTFIQLGEHGYKYVCIYKIINIENERKFSNTQLLKYLLGSLFISEEEKFKDGDRYLSIEIITTDHLNSLLRRGRKCLC